MKTLSEARKIAKLSQEELAEKCELTQASISQFENGKASPQPNTRKKIEEILGRINWLSTIGLKNYRDGEMTSWELTDQNFRKVLREIKGLRMEERIEFIKMARQYLKDFEKEYINKI